MALMAAASWLGVNLSKSPDIIANPNQSSFSPPIAPPLLRGEWANNPLMLGIPQNLDQIQKFFPVVGFARLLFLVFNLGFV
ncbi:MAG UNVERIFIED_CONTAM: hypothetical protein LVR29_08485 [Microcystis novacekii LVE1205-3]|jgi:hypothetical protein